jgi:hypothetical protein
MCKAVDAMKHSMLPSWGYATSVEVTQSKVVFALSQQAIMLGTPTFSSCAFAMLAE